MGKPRKIITAQKAIITLDLVHIASGFSGGGTRCALVLELISVVVVVRSDGVEEFSEDPRSSFLVVMSRTFFVQLGIFEMFTAWSGAMLLLWLLGGGGCQEDRRS